MFRIPIQLKNKRIAFAFLFLLTLPPIQIREPSECTSRMRLHYTERAADVLALRSQSANAETVPGGSVEKVQF